MAEFNAYLDAPAYRRMLSFGVPVTVVGLDVCGGEALWTDEQFEILSAYGEIGRFVSDSFSKIREFYARNGSAGTVMNCDSLAMMCVVDEYFVERTIRCFGSCVAEIGESYGQVIYYQDGFTYDMLVTDNLVYNITLVNEVDADGYFLRYLNRILH